MKFFLLVFCFVNLALAKVYKGELHFYHLQDKEIFAIVYDNAPMTPLFDRDKNQTSSSFLIVDDINGNLEIPLVKINDFWQDERKKYKINSSKMLTYDNKNFQGENLGTTTLELVETQDGIRIKRSLDFIGFNDDFKEFHPVHKGVFSFEQIRQKPIFLQDGKISFEEWYYFYEDGMSRAILELNNFVYDINAHTFVKLNDLYNTKNQKFQNLLHEKLKNTCDECFEDLQNLQFNNNFLLNNGKLKICYLPFEGHFLDENICVEFNEDELKEFKK
ncbi:hypothetical protein [Campylobacter jejuni]|uniref:hypothetical protein n=1 Tax=Campylobacter jejuni TaxID=197 RepID=UPI000C31F0B7|nr:hypothetical protein [Campylobacter jejuni]EAH5975333.1 hypothetical protein [Campylobacter jejuni]EAI4778125.1 hypothetical protein [Campylobacter jejuni]EAI8467223.1 hypothetical protein [Campylobacter jejuni]EAJ1256000.1 hypothetical protein [Campylobacter jejuni]EAJ8398337.1 hypothetical protein [Campylobacter jejuni]